jgi:hypothetical protein
VPQVTSQQPLFGLPRPALPQRGGRTLRSPEWSK